MKNKPTALVAHLRNVYMPLIRASIEVPKGEMYWLVNKCGTFYHRLNREGYTVKPDTLRVSFQPFPVESNWSQCQFTNVRTGNVYHIAFMVE